MSIQAFKWAKTWELKPLEKFVLMMICDYYNEKEKRSWPSQKTLARTTGMSVRTVSRCIAQLVEKGLIEVEPWVHSRSGAQMTNRYCLPAYDELSTVSENLPVFALFGYQGGEAAA